MFRAEANAFSLLKAASSFISHQTSHPKNRSPGDQSRPLERFEDQEHKQLEVST